MNEITLKAVRITKNNQPSIRFNDKSEYLDFIRDIKDGEEIVITIAKKRSLNQNALFHKWVSILSNDIGYDFDTMKVWLVCKFFGCKEEEIDGTIFTVPISTSKLNKKQFADGMTSLYAWATENGFNLPTIEL